MTMCRQCLVKEANADHSLCKACCLETPTRNRWREIEEQEAFAKTIDRISSASCDVDRLDFEMFWTAATSGWPAPVPHPSPACYDKFMTMLRESGISFGE